MSDKIADLITEVIEQMAFTPSPRLRQIMESAVRHLQAFANEVQLTPEEWNAGIDFFTESDELKNAERQELILLSTLWAYQAL